MIDQRDMIIKRHEDKIEELKEDFILEKSIKESEININRDLKQRLEQCEIHIETLMRINEHYASVVAKLRLKIKNFLSET
jgi:chaperonin cofactor prefoldin|tara:strand:+ start:866 stop:1105 length:240 start_codon:yes stop_codon:yes gene_type:complete